MADGAIDRIRISDGSFDRDGKEGETREHECSA